MKTFHCDHCDQLLFFENTLCVNCGHTLAYIPALGRVAALDKDERGGWRIADSPADSPTYKLCENYEKQNVCNWALPSEDPHTLCESCQLTQVLPSLDVPGHREAWVRLETAKRRLLYTLFTLDCPVVSKTVDPQGLSYQFLSAIGNQGPVLTGHDNGVITVNVAEADDAERERQRVRLHEPYRTLLGHFRHEIGHYYWQRLIDGSPRLEAFRQLFGDERADYAAALAKHYESGAPADWDQRFISVYASSHPWEDWAESWAHYLHMVDMLETAADSGLALRPRVKNEPVLKRARVGPEVGFDELINSWFPLTYVLNNLNRSMGLSDGYPFVLSTPVIEKLRFVHDTIAANRQK